MRSVLALVGVLSVAGQPTNFPEAKSTITSSDPLGGMAWCLKYFPLTVAADSGPGNVLYWMTGARWLQGRGQLIAQENISERRCVLHSDTTALVADSDSVAISNQGLGQTCGYERGKRREAGAEMYRVFAFNEMQCCNACVATEGCVGATFPTEGVAMTEMEGFGIHLPLVESMRTAGGLEVTDLEGLVRERLGDFSAFDQFMDYGVTFFTYDLQHYHDLFTADGVPCFVAQWQAPGVDATWYSLFVQLHTAPLVVELTSPRGPAAAGASFPQIEQRLRTGQLRTFSAYNDSLIKRMYPASLNRATSSPSQVQAVYSDLLGLNMTEHFAEGDAARLCYSVGWDPAYDICFRSRAPDASKDAIFSAGRYEEMLWAVHATMLSSGPESPGDRYQDHHYTLAMTDGVCDALQRRFTATSPYPLRNTTRFAYSCSWRYLIDPTGWSIQPGGCVGRVWPGCGATLEPRGNVFE